MGGAAAGRRAQVWLGAAMTERPEHHHDSAVDPLEDGLRELGEAEAAGLFRLTRLDPSALIRPVRRVPFFADRQLFWMPLAACVALAIGVGAYYFYNELAEIAKRRGQFMTTQFALADGSSFIGCLEGPGRHSAELCGSFDYDHDGDVDLVDYSHHQLGH
jgi:hypothetical protein